MWGARTTAGWSRCSSRARFVAFVERHNALATAGIAVVAEDNDAMEDSYVMIDPLGRFYGNHEGRHRVSAPILEVGVHAGAWSR